MDSYDTDYLTDLREIELSEYMSQARPSFTKSALCRGTIYSEIEAAQLRALERGITSPLDISTTFFPSRGGATKVAKAKEMCNRCPVQWECFQYAYDGNEDAGVWGGTSVDERDSFHRDEKTAQEVFVELFGRRRFNRQSKNKP